jgi:transcription initiation factor TFIIA small subunit
MSYQVYRNTTLGTTLQDSLDELLANQQISRSLKDKVLEEYDKAINNALATRVRNRINFKGQLNTYRFCDNVWTFVIEEAEFREVIESIKVKKVKVVACDGKNAISRLDE